MATKIYRQSLKLKGSEDDSGCKVTEVYVVDGVDAPLEALSAVDDDNPALSIPAYGAVYSGLGPRGQRIYARNIQVEAEESAFIVSVEYQPVNVDSGGSQQPPEPDSEEWNWEFGSETVKIKGQTKADDIAWRQQYFFKDASAETSINFRKNKDGTLEVDGADILVKTVGLTVTVHVLASAINTAYLQELENLRLTVNDAPWPHSGGKYAAFGDPGTWLFESFSLNDKILIANGIETRPISFKFRYKPNHNDTITLWGTNTGSSLDKASMTYTALGHDVVWAQSEVVQIGDTGKSQTVISRLFVDSIYPSASWNDLPIYGVNIVERQAIVWSGGRMY
jgi:hypothetical protein